VHSEGVARRSEKPTLQLPLSVIAYGPRAQLLAEQLHAMGGSVKEVSDQQVIWTAPETHLVAAQQAVDEFCACGAPGQVLVPAGDEYEGAEIECWDCCDTVTEFDEWGPR
jgi:hypothetical protein